MTKIGKRLAAILLAVAMAITIIPIMGTQTAYAADIVDSGKAGISVNWTLYDDGTLLISGVGQMENSELLPEYIDYKESIKTVAISCGVTKIGDYAFYQLSSMTEITIPNSVTSIGVNAFAYCHSLESIVIPNHVSNIQSTAFAYCSNLSSIFFTGNKFNGGLTISFANVTATAYYPAGDTTWAGVGNNSSDNITWRAYDLTASGDCGEYVTWILIGDGTFTVSGIGPMWKPSEYAGEHYGCYEYLDNVKKVVIKNRVTEIAPVAFMGMSNMTEISIPESVTTIGECAFEECTSLTNITIPNSVKSIGEDIFCGCRSLKYVSVDAGNKWYCTIDGVVFSADKTVLVVCPMGKDGNFEIPDGVTRINSHAFCQSRLTVIMLPNSVTGIDNKAFTTCENLASIIIPPNVSRIKDYAFQNCASLREIFFSGNAPSFGADVFYNVTATAYYPEGDTTWTEDVRKNYEGEITWIAVSKPTVVPEKVNVPSGKTLTYNGKAQTGVPEGANYTITGNTATNAGSHTANLSLKDKTNYTWADGTTTDKTVKWTINKAANPLTMKAKTATVKYSKLKKKAQTLAVTKVIKFTKDAKDKKTYTLSSAKKGKKSFKKYFTINKSTGKVTVKKGLKKGTYKVKVKVKAAGNANYKASAVKTVTFTVKVK